MEENMNVVAEIDEMTDVVENNDSTATGVIVGAAVTAGVIGAGYLVVKGAKKLVAKVKRAKLKKQAESDESEEFIDYEEEVERIHEAEEK